MGDNGAATLLESKPLPMLELPRERGGPFVGPRTAFFIGTATTEAVDRTDELRETADEDDDREDEVVAGGVAVGVSGVKAEGRLGNDELL